MGLESAILTSSLGGFLITLKWRATVWLPAFLLAHLSLFSRSYAHFYQLSHSNILSLSKLSFIVKLQGLPIIQRIKSWSLSNQGPTQYGQQLLCDSPLFQNKDTWTLGLRHLTPIWILSLSYSPMRNRSNSLIPSQFDAKKEKKKKHTKNQPTTKQIKTNKKIICYHLLLLELSCSFYYCEHACLISAFWLLIITKVKHHVFT